MTHYQLMDLQLVNIYTILYFITGLIIHIYVVITWIEAFRCRKLYCLTHYSFIMTITTHCWTWSLKSSNTTTTTGSPSSASSPSGLC